MRCAWKELLAIVPSVIRDEVDRMGREDLQELRLRVNGPPELVLAGGSHWLEGTMTRDQLNFVVNAATRYSPWRAESMARGYLTASGGHRIGLCGEVVCKNGSVTGIDNLQGLCIRVARDFPGIGKAAAILDTSILILGPPGTGKTTLLRDLIRQLAKTSHVAVVDERCELFPDGFDRGRCTDTLLGCPKAEGVEMLLRTMGPDYIAVDEITAEDDALALARAACCGSRLLATAHAGSLEDFMRRGAYRHLREANVFSVVLILNRNKQFTLERIHP